MIVQWICHAVNKCTFALFNVCLSAFDLFVFDLIFFFISMWWALPESITGKKKKKQQPNVACSL